MTRNVAVGAKKRTHILFPTPSPQIVSETALYLQSHWAPDRPSDYKSRYRLSSFFSFYPSCKIRPSARVLAPHAIIFFFFMPSYAIRIDRRRNMLSVVVVVLYGPLLVMRCCNVVKRMSLISTHSSGTYSWALASYFPSPMLHFSFKFSDIIQGVPSGCTLPFVYFKTLVLSW